LGDVEPDVFEVLKFVGATNRPFYETIGLRAKLGTYGTIDTHSLQRSTQFPQISFVFIANQRIHDPFNQVAKGNSGKIKSTHDSDCSQANPFQE